MPDQGQEFYLSQAAFDEFNHQDVFGTMEEFIEAMPPATRGVHLIPVELVDGQKSSTVASDAGLFQWLTYVHTTPDREDPPQEDESIFRVDDANDLLKDQQGGYLTSPSNPEKNQNSQYMRDEGLQDISLIELPYDRDTFPEHHQTHHRPGEDYEESNYYRDFDNEKNEDLVAAALFAAMLMDTHPVVLLPEMFTKSKTAAKWSEIINGINPDVVNSARGCKPSLKRADPKNNRWTFTVVDYSGSGKTHTVHMKAVPRGNAVDMNKVDLKLGCSCEFWKWQGPDYHAHKGGYLDRKKRSDGTAPTVRDPNNINRVCKHVYAASNMFLKYRLRKRNKKSSMRIASEAKKQASHTIPAKQSIKLRGLICEAEAVHLNAASLARRIAIQADKIHTQTHE